MRSNDRNTIDREWPARLSPPPPLRVDPVRDEMRWCGVGGKGK